MRKSLKIFLAVAIAAVAVCVAVLAIKTNGFKDIFDKNKGDSQVDDIGYTFDLEINDKEMGTVTVDAIDPEVGTVMTLKAKPNYGYVFVGWYVDGELLSAETEFTYIMPERDVTMLGVFAKDVFSLKVMSMNPGFTAAIEGTYEYLSEISITANDISGTTFVAWFCDGEIIGKVNQERRMPV